ncbi:MAG: hypothetical protein C0593_03665 [Marinilabiliales bacterium]|nr:MAG: hypothetical protein C0593_03665 [Marinilabiliales bacterium]
MQLNASKFIFLFFILFSLSGMGQQPYSNVDFRSPVDFPILLSGTFGELRSGHFHSGIDIKTGGVSGKDIHAIGDGWVSRVKVSPGGFGNAIYITHPEGYTSVYAHLDEFGSKVSAYVLSEQYKRKSFAVDIPVAKGRFPVKKGEVIAKSGNSGSSAGPHLHFEIRDAATQNIINPLHFGFKVKDFIRPKITGLMVCPESDTTLIDGKNVARKYNLEGWGPVYRPADEYKISVSGPFSLGVKAHDILNDSYNKNGVYRYEMFVDNQKIFSWRADIFSFSETRYINSFVDYENYVNRNGRYIRTAIDPNNKLSMYDGGNGIIDFKEPGEHTLKFLALDFAGDTSVLTIGFIASINPENPVDKYISKSDENSVYLRWDEPNEITRDFMNLKMVSGTLFDDMDIVVKNEPLPQDIKGFSGLVTVGDITQTSYLNFDLALDVSETQTEVTDKICLAMYDEGEISFAGGSYDNGKVAIRTRSFGQYFVTADTIAPEITPVNLSLQGGTKLLKFKISDDLSGISDYKAFFNDRWVLFRYDAKNDLIWYERDKHLPKGKIDFKLVVTDGKGNEATFERALVN